MTAVKISASFIVCKRSYRRIKQSIFVFFFNMEKSEFRVLIKHCFLMGKNTIKTKEDFIQTMKLLLKLMLILQPLRNRTILMV